MCDRVHALAWLTVYQHEANDCVPANKSAEATSYMTAVRPHAARTRTCLRTCAHECTQDGLVGHAAVTGDVVNFERACDDRRLSG